MGSSTERATGSGPNNAKNPSSKRKRGYFDLSATEANKRTKTEPVVVRDKGTSDEAQRELLEERRETEQKKWAEEREFRRLRGKKLGLEDERRRQKKFEAQEEKARKKLQELGVCVAGYRWQREPGGWRCEGGSHFMKDADMGL